MNDQIPTRALRELGVGGYTMRTARRRYRAEKNTNARGLSFRTWARRTYNPDGAHGKLARIVGAKRKDRRR